MNTRLTRTTLSLILFLIIGRVSLAADAPEKVDLAELAKNRADWPAIVTLKVPVIFPLVVGGKKVGETEAPSGHNVKLLEVLGNDIRVSDDKRELVIPATMTDLLERVAKARRDSAIAERAEEKAASQQRVKEGLKEYKGPVTDAQVEAAVRKAIIYLLNTQDEEDGGWAGGEAKSAKSRIALTSVSCQALMAFPQIETERSAIAVRRGLEYILQRTGDRTKLTTKLRPTAADWAIFGTPFALRGLLEFRKYADNETRATIDHNIKELIAALEASQRDDWTWTYNPGHSQTFTSANVLHALARARETGFTIHEQRAANGAKRLLSKKVHDAWPYSFGSTGAWVKGAQGRAAQCELSLYLLKTPGITLKTLGRVVDNFFTNYTDLAKARGSHGHLPPYQNAGYYFYWGHYFEAEALRYMSKDVRAKYYPILASLTVHTQGVDGSFFDAPCGGKPYGTGMALMTLSLSQPLKTDVKFKLPAKSAVAAATNQGFERDNTKRDKDNQETGKEDEP